MWTRPLNGLQITIPSMEESSMVKIPLLTDHKPYTFKRKYWFFFLPLSLWSIYFDDTEIRIMRANKSTISDAVLLLNAAYQEGWMARAKLTEN